MRKTLTILIGFIHDFAAGIWAATLFAVYKLDRAEAGAIAVPLQKLEQELFWIGIGAVVAVLVFGAGRTFTYVDNFYGEDAERHRRKMLMIKHIILFVVFGLGIWWQYRLAF